MIDEIAIQQTINQWSEAASRAALDEAAATFTPDGIWEIPGGMQFQGPAKISEGIDGFVAHMEFLMQMNAPAVIKVDGDTATARSVIREAGRAKGASEGFEAFGIYVDKLVRTKDGWKFTHRVFQLRGTAKLNGAPPALR
jgi:ketosteroid isomerase-like protein